MSDGDSLLQAIIANPADDLPRLAYADWLEERGQVGQANFIRRQLLSPGEVIDIESGGSLHRSDAEQVRSPAHRERCVIRRGFIEAIHTTLADWLSHGHETVRRHPILRVVLTDVSLTLHEDAGAPRWALPPDLPFLEGPGLSFESEAAARDALSRACLAWARTGRPVRIG
jgi:uncharacterized protein (TIGR02996 family)